ncbi:DUF1801 domain-containing protein [Tabrizicola sp.]|uniref:DUF1801 domain-containing protein n=1 Tax=Tabrizicola sp. TaxID=2005166 RepID=UPI003F3F2C5F
MTAAPPPTPEVAAVFAAASPEAREGLLALRSLIFTVASQTPSVGPLTEALRWGQPAYLTLESGSGCSLRIGPAPQGFGLFVHCQTSLIEDFRAGPGAAFHTSGTRAVLFQSADEVDQGAIAPLISRALTWHKRAR